jgi:hypothetical protein
MMASENYIINQQKIQHPTVINKSKREEDKTTVLVKN